MEDERDGANIVELKCNLDDMSPEAIAFAMETLMQQGARDVFTTPVGMKKSRPGVLLTCICYPRDVERMTGLMLKYTTTLGVRETLCRRHILDIAVRTVSTAYGDIRVKEATGYGVVKHKCEYEDAAQAARLHGVTLDRVFSEVERVLSGENA